MRPEQSLERIGDGEWRRYLVWMLGAAVLVLALCGGLTVAVDPLGIFGVPRIPKFNAVKPLLEHHGTLARWRAAQRLCPRAGIFGNSRAQIGLNPEHEAFAARGLMAFNHAIQGTSIDSSKRQLRWLVEAGCAPKLIVIGVEFFDFLGGDPVLPEPEAATRAPTIDLTAISETVFSLTAVRDSLATLRLQHAAYPAQITARGFNPLLNYEAEVAASGHSVMFRQRAQENVKAWSRKPKRLAAPGGGPSSDKVDLEAFLSQASEQADEVHVVIYPYHAQLRLMIEQAGLSDLYQQWKRDMEAAVRRVAGGHAKVRLWDFSAISDETLEAVPGPDDRRTRMARYWEAGHFKNQLGDRMLAQMLQGRPGFGVELRQDMIEDWLSRDEARAKDLLGSPSALQTEVVRLFSR